MATKLEKDKREATRFTLAAIDREIKVLEDSPEIGRDTIDRMKELRAMVEGRWRGRQPMKVRSLDPRNKTGITGIQFNWAKSKGGGRSPQFAVTYPEPGTRGKMMRFNVNVLGFDEALRQAAELRAQKEREFLGSVQPALQRVLDGETEHLRRKARREWKVPAGLLK